MIFLTGLTGLTKGCYIFDEISKLRAKVKCSSSRIDDEVGSENIASHFAEIYSVLYNRVENGTKLDEVSDRINAGIDEMSRGQLDRVDDNLIKTALKRMKSNKRDAIFDTHTDPEPRMGFSKCLRASKSGSTLQIIT